MGFERYPALQDVGIKTWVNGAFTFSPDGNPLVALFLANEATGAPVQLWRVFCKVVASVNLLPNG